MPPPQLRLPELCVFMLILSSHPCHLTTRQKYRHILIISHERDSAANPNRRHKFPASILLTVVHFGREPRPGMAVRTLLKNQVAGANRLGCPCYMLPSVISDHHHQAHSVFSPTSWIPRGSILAINSNQYTGLDQIPKYLRELL